MININSVTKKFKDNVVLNNITTKFDEGSGIVALLGPSGAGKSTLLRCINGLEGLNGGDITIEGLSIKEHKNLQKIRMTCGMVFQQTSLFPHLNVLQNLTLAPTHLLKITEEEAKEKAMTLLEKVGLKNKAESKHNELSGGEQQRISIARSLMMSPKAILLDEITSSLDPEMGVEVLNILEKLSKTDKVVMIMVTHEIDFARRVASRILFLEHGDIVCDSTKEEFFTHDRQNNERINKFLQYIS